MRRWPPWRREEPRVRSVEPGGERVQRARDQTDQMGQEIQARSEEVQEAAADLAQIIMRSMRGGR